MPVESLATREARAHWALMDPLESFPDRSLPPLVSIGEANGVSAGINAFGAELWRLRAPDGRDLQWNGDPAVWKGRAPILFPIIGRLKGDRYRLGGREFHLEKHGFARRMRFAVAEVTANSARFVLLPTAQTRAVYPFEFALALTFAVDRSSLAVTAVVGNAGEAPMPFSFGFHPALRWPLPFGEPRGAHRLLFDQPEPERIRRIDRNGLLAGSEPSPVTGRRLVLRDDLFDEDALFFVGLESCSLRYGADDGPQIRVDFPDFPDLGVWTKPGADYICIEPWQGFNDPADFDGDLGEKPGMLVLAAGAEWRSTMTLTLEDDEQ